MDDSEYDKLSEKDKEIFDKTNRFWWTHEKFRLNSWKG